ncbi:MAG: hypothetical protein MUF45_15485 [Spirosomaceae bacterium]|nr:hypothetical protein [Spirosomataceae bacterium]
MDIVNKVKQLIEREKKKIVLFFDADGTYADNESAFAEVGIRWVEVNKNYFEVKYKLEFEWQNEFVFLYHPFAHPADASLKKYPLLDILVANPELRLDDVSEFMAEFTIPIQYQSLVRKYIQVLKTKTNQRKLAKVLDTDNFTENNLKQGLISLALDFNTVADKNTCIVRWLSYASDDRNLQKANKTLKDLELDTHFLGWLNALVDGKFTELSVDVAREVTSIIKYNVLAIYINQISKNDTYAPLRLSQVSAQNRISLFFQEAAKDSQQKQLIENIFEELGSG